MTVATLRHLASQLDVQDFRLELAFRSGRVWSTRVVKRQEKKLARTGGGGAVVCIEPVSRSP